MNAWNCSIPGIIEDSATVCLRHRRNVVNLNETYPKVCQVSALPRYSTPPRRGSGPGLAGVTHTAATASNFANNPTQSEDGAKTGTIMCFLLSFVIHITEAHWIWSDSAEIYLTSPFIGEIILGNCCYESHHGSTQQQKVICQVLSVFPTQVLLFMKRIFIILAFKNNCTWANTQREEERMLH